MNGNSKDVEKNWLHNQNLKRGRRVNLLAEIHPGQGSSTQLKASLSQPLPSDPED